MKKKKLKWLGGILICLILTGCSDGKVDGFELSTLKVEKDGSLAYVVGDIKNVSGKDCKYLYIDVELKNGGITEKETINIFDKIKNNEKYHVNGVIFGDYDEKYEVKVKHIDCTSCNVVDCDDDEDDDDYY